MNTTKPKLGECCLARKGRRSLSDVYGVEKRTINGKVRHLLVHDPKQQLPRFFASREVCESILFPRRRWKPGTEVLGSEARPALAESARSWVLEVDFVPPGFIRRILNMIARRPRGPA